ncbi:STAS domain-containing protein [Novosphingobium sp. FKTRR1]|uniref:STAS domain-containing protein n=1 Tax=Novosphingobium sp. FKTRR1 TaxID=2879118 RepID=UPI001CEFD511
MEISIGEMATMSHVTDMFQRIKEHVATDDISVDLSGTSTIDASFVQLIEVARRHSENHGHSLRLTGPVSPTICAHLANIGIAPDGIDADPDKSDLARFWLGAGQG